MENNEITTKNLSPILPQNSHHNHDKIKPIFKHSAIWRSFDIPHIRKSKPKMLSSVTLISFQNPNTISLRSLTKALTDSKVVSCLNLQDPDINVKQFSQILNVTNHWTNISFQAAATIDHLNQTFRKSLTRLQKCKNLSAFPFLTSLSPDHITTKTANCLYRQLRGLNKLTTLTLDIPFYENEANILKYKPPRCLTNLTLNFKSNVQHHLPQFISSIQQRCNPLETLSLDFYHQYNIEPSDAHIWTAFFKNPPKHLRKLNLIIQNLQLSEEGIKAFIETFKSFKQPKILHLYFAPAVNINFFFNHRLPPFSFDDLLPSLLVNLQSLTQLEELKLHLWLFNLFPNPTLKYFASMLQCLKNLKNLSVEIPGIVSISEGLMILSQGFKELNHLKVFNLEFFSTKVSSQEMRILSNSLAHLDLKSLKLRFGYLLFYDKRSPITHTHSPGVFEKLFGTSQNKESPSLAPFFPDLSQFNQLSHLHLLFSTFNISTQEFKQLSLALKQLPILSSLSLDLPEFDSKDNFEGLRSILFCLKDMPKLTDLSLWFDGEKICDQEVGIISSNLAQCKSLKSLDLKFKDVSQLKDQSLYFLLVGIQNLVALESLDLLFDNGERQFGNQTVSDFLEGLVVLKHLKSLNFVYNLSSILLYTSNPLPEHLWSYLNMKQITCLIVNNSRYI